jgi:predicted HAD superfamily Cof-like phosphohydrolase
MSEENSNNNIVMIEDYFMPDYSSNIGEDETVQLYTDAPWWLDNFDMHDKFEFHDAIGKMDAKMLRQMLVFRLKFLQEELDEAKNATSAEDVVDAMIDLCVVAIGTLDCYDVDAQEAWNRVHLANMAKERGIKLERPNPLGLPDLVKPEGWQPPSHMDNHGIMDKIDFTLFYKEFE